MKKYAKFIEYDYERNSYGYDFYPICEIYNHGERLIIKSNNPVNLYDKKENPLLYKPGDRLIVKYKNDDFEIIKKSYRHVTIPIICLILILAILIIPDSIYIITNNSSVSQLTQTTVLNCFNFL